MPASAHGAGRCDEQAQAHRAFPIVLTCGVRTSFRGERAHSDAVYNQVRYSPRRARTSSGAGTTGSALPGFIEHNFYDLAIQRPGKPDTLCHVDPPHWRDTRDVARVYRERGLRMLGGPPGLSGPCGRSDVQVH